MSINQDIQRLKAGCSRGTVKVCGRPHRGLLQNLRWDIEVYDARTVAVFEEWHASAEATFATWGPQFGAVMPESIALVMEGMIGESGLCVYRFDRTFGMLRCLMFNVREHDIECINNFAMLELDGSPAGIMQLDPNAAAISLMLAAGTAALARKAAMVTAGHYADLYL